MLLQSKNDVEAGRNLLAYNIVNEIVDMPRKILAFKE